MERHITLPLTEELAKSLHAGDSVYLTGTIYTSRDAGHKRMCEALARGEELPFDPKDATIYYVGPTPAKPGQVFYNDHIDFTIFNIISHTFEIRPVKIGSRKSIVHIYSKHIQFVVLCKLFQYSTLVTNAFRFLLITVLL